MADLTGELRRRGDFTDPAWELPFALIPRHAFMPAEIWSPGGGDAVERATGTDWWDTVHSDITVATHVSDTGADTPEGRRRRVVRSVAPPSVLVWLLRELNVTDTSRILLLGPDTGYTAALLAARAGRENVTAMATEEESAAWARARLEATGWSLPVVVGALEKGVPENAPVDRVFATAAVDEIPYTWVEQTAPGGVIVAPWGSTDSGAALVRLTVDAHGGASGPVIGDAGVLWPAEQRLPASEWRDHVGSDTEARVSTTTADLDEVLRLDSSARFVVGVLVRELCQVGGGEGVSPRSRVWLHDRNGSWAAVDPGDGEHTVRQHGARRLWDEVETAYQWWRGAGRPDRTRFGVTVNPAGPSVWLDRPDNVIRP